MMTLRSLANQTKAFCDSMMLYPSLFPPSYATTVGWGILGVSSLLLGPNHHNNMGNSSSLCDISIGKKKPKKQQTNQYPFLIQDFSLMLVKSQWVPGLSSPGLQSVGFEIQDLWGGATLGDGPLVLGKSQHCRSKAIGSLPQGLSHREISYPVYLTLKLPPSSSHLPPLWCHISAF